MRGKRGAYTAVFRALKNAPRILDLFFGVSFWDKVLHGELGLDRFDRDKFCSEGLAADSGEA